MTCVLYPKMDQVFSLKKEKKSEKNRKTQEILSVQKSGNYINTSSISGSAQRPRSKKRTSDKYRHTEDCWLWDDERVHKTEWLLQAESCS